MTDTERWNRCVSKCNILRAVITRVSGKSPTPRPRRSITPGLKFSITTSALSTSRRRLLASGRLEVERDASLAAPQEGVGVRLPTRSHRRIDVNHVGALVGQHDRRERPGDVLAEVDDSDPIHRARHGA